MRILFQTFGVFLMAALIFGYCVLFAELLGRLFDALDRKHEARVQKKYHE